MTFTPWHDIKSLAFSLIEEFLSRICNYCFSISLQPLGTYKPLALVAFQALNHSISLQPLGAYKPLHTLCFQEALNHTVLFRP